MSKTKKKPAVTRTYGPIHFEDLDPHRFEDLIRELIYDYKDWQSIEATGRNGGDDGFDIRAYEKQAESFESVIDDADADEKEQRAPHPMDGNLWMIQGKREKELGPTKVENILSQIDEMNPPYGYILAASANFSKGSYDVFREVLRRKGVMEFYLWGKAELEDMLHQPKNDRILFTFFGVSLVSRRRSRSTEVRSAIAIKNKLFRIFGESSTFREQMLVRDLADTHYPNKKKYADFDDKPRWVEVTAFGFHTRGILVNVVERYAYIDKEKKEYDFTGAVNLLSRPSISEYLEQRSINDQKERVADVIEFYPRVNQARFCVDALIVYQDIIIVDEKGDVKNKFPHVYIDFAGESPFSRNHQYIQIDDQQVELDDEYRRVTVFPATLQKPPRYLPRSDKKLELDAATLKGLREFDGIDALYDIDGRYSHLRQRDVIAIANEGPEILIQVTCKIGTTFGEYLKGARPMNTMRWISQQIGRSPDPAEKVTVYEFRRYYLRAEQ